jgi:hypothetical protein
MKQIFYKIIVCSMLAAGFTPYLSGQVSTTGCSATGTNATAIGYNSSALHRYSFAAGNHTQATAAQSFVFGSTSTISDIFTPETSYLTNSTPNSFLIGFEGHPVFFAQWRSVAYAPGTGSKTMATYITCPCSPRVGIGTIKPEENLDVNGNMIADTIKIRNSIFLPNDEFSISYYYSDVQQDSLGGYETKGKDTTGTEDIVMGSGVRSAITGKISSTGGFSLGIGTENPQAKLHVTGSAIFSSAVRIGQDYAPLAVLFKVDGSAGIKDRLVVGTTVLPGLETNVKLSVGGNTRLSGNVAIGMDTIPNNTKLAVAGNSYFSGNIGLGTASPHTIITNWQ